MLLARSIYEVSHQVTRTVGTNLIE
jgi:hypothetical protein